MIVVLFSAHLLLFYVCFIALSSLMHPLFSVFPSPIPLLFICQQWNMTESGWLLIPLFVLAWSMWDDVIKEGTTIML